MLALSESVHLVPTRSRDLSLGIGLQPRKNMPSWWHQTLARDPVKDLHTPNTGSAPSGIQAPLVVCDLLQP
jgi:hypothetical protein